MASYMKYLVWYCNILFIFSYVSQSTNSYPNTELTSRTLKTANLFFRHGARTPLVTIPPKAKFDVQIWSAQLGELTQVGKEKTFELGLRLRKMYKNFLSHYYIPGEIHVSSTPAERTSNSAKALLAGLYNIGGYTKWSEEIPLTSVPISTDDLIIDKAGAVNSQTACPAFKTEQRFSLLQAMNDDTAFQDVYEYLSLYAGSKINGLFDIFTVWDILECLAHNNLELPQWAPFVYPERMSSLQAKLLRALIAGTKKMIRLMAGPYIQEVHNQFKEALMNKPTVKKLVVHAGHDFSLTANLSALGIFEKIINPSDAMILELHELPFAGFFVQLRFLENGGSSATIVPIKNCGQPCPLYKFLQLTSDVIPSNWQLECIM